MAVCKTVSVRQLVERERRNRGRRAGRPRGSDFSLLACSFHVDRHRIPSLVLRVSLCDRPPETVWASRPYEMVHLIPRDDDNIWWGSFKCGVADRPLRLELSHCFPCQLRFSFANAAGAIRSLRRSDALPLGAACLSALIQTILPGNCFPSLPGRRESCGTHQAYYTQFPSLPDFPGEVKLVIYSDFSHLVDELRRA